MNIDRATAISVSDDLIAAINEVFDRHGLTAGQHKIKYGPYLTFSIDASIDGPTKNGVNTSSKEALAWIRDGHMWGIPSPVDALGETIVSAGKAYAFAGLRTRAPKRPLLFIEVDTGKQYVFGSATVSKLPGYDATKDLHN